MKIKPLVALDDAELLALAQWHFVRSDFAKNRDDEKMHMQRAKQLIGLISGKGDDA